MDDPIIDKIVGGCVSVVLRDMLHLHHTPHTSHLTPHTSILPGLHNPIVHNVVHNRAIVIQCREQ